VAGPDGQAYKARQVIFETVPMGSQASSGVKVREVLESKEPMRKVHNPTHPMADAQGYVNQSNVNPIEEMVNMISASRSYQNNVEVMNTSKELLLATLRLGQG
jgi:flagellar basal-body rod protein FlgC